LVNVTAPPPVEPPAAPLPLPSKTAPALKPVAVSVLPVVEIVRPEALNEVVAP
jgi:hypothetical protein